MIADKFNDENALINSYKELEKEFTKKCQELARVKQELQAVSSPVDVVEPQVKEIEVVEVLPQAVQVEVAESEVIEPIQDIQVVEDEVVEKAVPTQNGQFDLKFRAKVNEFFKNSPEAKEYSKEISKILLTDRSILNCSDPFKVAYLLAKDGKGKIENDDAIEKVFVKEPELQVSPVTVLSGKLIGSAPRTDNKRCKSITEAGEEVIKRYF